MRRRLATRCRCLLAADARVELRSAAGTRRVPLTSFYTGYRQTVARAGRTDRRASSSGRSRPPMVPQGRHARRAGDREGRHRGCGDGRARARPRLAMGSVAPTVVRLHRPNRRSAAGRRSPRRSDPSARDRAHRRHSIDGRVPPAGGGESPWAVLGCLRTLNVLHDAAFRAGAAPPT